MARLKMQFVPQENVKDSPSCGRIHTVRRDANIFFLHALTRIRIINLEKFSDGGPTGALTQSLRYSSVGNKICDGNQVRSRNL